MNSFPDPAKAFAAGFIDRNDRAFITLNDSIFYFGELGMQETRSAGLMTAILERHGFSVQRGISGFATSFVATYGQGGPVIAIHTEYDANPSNSQKSGIAERAEIVPGAPGHCEGHNTNAAVMIASALAIRHAMEKFALPGTLKIFGASAEEQLLSRPYFVRDGLFDDVDLAFHDHVLDRFGTDYGVIQSAAISAEFTFHGETAHAAVSPWKGRDALDAVVLMDVGIAQYREHMKPTMTAHRVITNGGEQPNVIPSKAACWWYFRDPKRRGRARPVSARAEDRAGRRDDGQLRTRRRRARRRLARAAEPDDRRSHSAQCRACRHAVMDGEGERVCARPAEAGRRSRDRIAPFCRRWKVRRCRSRRPTIAATCPGRCRWAESGFPATCRICRSITGPPARRSPRRSRTRVGSQARRRLRPPSSNSSRTTTLVAETKVSFSRELAGTVYRPLLPEDQRAPAHLNLALMEKFRPQMEAHYLSDEPVFATP